MQIAQILKNRNSVLGQNSRNLDYIKNFSNPYGRKIADDKLLSKKILTDAGIPVPELIGIIKNYKDLSKFNWEALPKSFVMKPVHGSQGGGIEIFYNKDEDGNWIRSDGSKKSINDLTTSSQDIIDGKYSLHNEQDQLLFEQRIKSHPNLKNYCYKGVPDIRVVVFNKIPIMAYVRFPTRESKGKANMILGAVGTGIDLATGVTTTSTYGKGNNGKGDPIEYVPGTGLRYQGLKIPFWDKILTYSLRTQNAVGLDFLAVDFLIDEKRGPVVVEINARPGLSIQIVNRAGLAWRLTKASDLKVKSISHGIRLGKDLFGGQIEEQIEKISGKDIISNIVALRIINDKYTVETLALVDTSRRTTILDQETAKKLKLISENINLGTDEYIPTVINFKIGSNEIESDARIVSKKIKGYKIIVGRNDLKDFIIDIKKSERPSEQDKIINIISNKPFNKIDELDEAINEITKKLVILPTIRPINLVEEKTKFFEKHFKYNPIFFYKPLKFNPDLILDKLDELRPPEDNIGELYKNKISELKRMVHLVNDIGNDPENFTNNSNLLYGEISQEKVNLCHKLIEKYKSNIEANNFVSAEKELTIDQVVKEIQIVLDKLHIKSDITITDAIGRTKMSVSVKRGKIFLNKNYHWNDERLRGSIAHEVLTHLVRLKNGKSQASKIFAIGSSKYFKTEEGLATLMKYTSRKDMLMFTPAVNYLSINLALNNDFKNVFNNLLNYLKPVDAWNFAYRVKRGIKFTENHGAFTKDQYYSWTLEVAEEIIRDPKSLDYLFNGKANIDELELLTKPDPSYRFENLTIEKIQEFLQANT